MDIVFLKLLDDIGLAITHLPGCFCVCIFSRRLFWTWYHRNILCQICIPYKGILKRSSGLCNGLSLQCLCFVPWIPSCLMCGSPEFGNFVIKNSCSVSLAQEINCTWNDDVNKWIHFPRYWPFVRGIHRSPMNSPHKGQWRGALMFSLICVSINGWVNNREAGDLRRYRAHNDVIVMLGLLLNHLNRCMYIYIYIFTKVR